MGVLGTLQPLIYQTTDKEAAIRSMAARNESSLVFEYQWCRSRVRTRHNLIADLDSVLLLSWDSNRQAVIKKWQKEKGLMIYRHMPRFDNMPEADAVLFTEMPLTFRNFKRFQGRARKEIIIYRPPDWSLHDTTVDQKYPRADAYSRIISALRTMIVEQGDLTRNQEIAIANCGWPADQCAVFNAEKIVQMAAIDASQVKSMFKHFFQMRGHYVRLDPYKPMMEPHEPDLLEMYRILESFPNAGNGIRLLRFGHAENYIKFFQKALRILVKNNCVAKYDPVHIVKSGFKDLDDEINDAVVGVYRNSYMKLRTMVEEAPSYPL